MDMNEANSSKEDTDLTAGSILFRLANGRLTTSKEEKSTKTLKPGWVAFVKPWINKFDLTACEVKPPNKSVSSPLSDFVKLGVPHPHPHPQPQYLHLHLHLFFRVFSPLPTSTSPTRTQQQQQQQK
ncbi:hypothetical protein BC941DRAFT_465702 [Chlamydoabsidia padenii]|nr:hypothetical protein BC941DRAFT_465702 [Chlamydoabsidia padenii]